MIVRLIVKAPTILVTLKTRRKGEETAEIIPRKEAYNDAIISIRFHLKEKEENIAAPLRETERRIIALKSSQQSKRKTTKLLRRRKSQLRLK